MYKYSKTPLSKCVNFRKWCFNWWIFRGKRHSYEGFRILGHKFEKVIPLTKFGAVAKRQYEQKKLKNKIENTTR